MWRGYIGGVVHVTEDVVVGTYLVVVLCYILHKRLYDLGALLRAVRFAGFATPPLTKTQEEVGVDKPRCRLAQCARTEYPIHQTQHRQIVDIHIVAMRHKEPFACNLKYLWLGVELYATLLGQIVADPHIVIACEHNNSYTLVVQLGQATQHTHKTLWYNSFILKPEVEDIAHEEERFAVALDLLQEVKKVALHSPLLCGTARAKVYVRNKVVHTP